METLARQRCLNHNSREAVARCPECRSFYCRECVTEHEDRLICAACLRKLTTRTRPAGRRLAIVRQAAQLSAGVFLAWLLFYFAGQVLISIPSEFHEGTIWQAGIFDEE